MSLTELINTLLAKKDSCNSKRKKIAFIKLGLNTVWWVLENFTVDLTIEYLQCIQVIDPKHKEEHFNSVGNLLKKLLEKVSVSEKEGYGISTNMH